MWKPLDCGAEAPDVLVKTHWAAGRSPSAPHNSSGDSAACFFWEVASFCCRVGVIHSVRCLDLFQHDGDFISQKSSHRPRPSRRAWRAFRLKEKRVIIVSSCRWQHVCLQKSSWGLNAFHLLPSDGESPLFSLVPVKRWQRKELKLEQVQAVRERQSAVSHQTAEDAFI